jgi:hypothetical protein
LSDELVTPCFDDWKRFCAVLREIASGDNGRPLSSVEALKCAQAVLDERGYTWPLAAHCRSREAPLRRCDHSAASQNVSTERYRAAGMR